MAAYLRRNRLPSNPAWFTPKSLYEFQFARLPTGPYRSTSPYRSCHWLLPKSLRPRLGELRQLRKRRYAGRLRNRYSAGLDGPHQPDGGGAIELVKRVSIDRDFRGFETGGGVADRNVLLVVVACDSVCKAFLDAGFFGARNEGVAPTWPRMP